MKANEFVKKFGLSSFKVAMICPQFNRYNYAILYSDEVDFSNKFIEKHADYMFKTSDIKRLADSHELVERLGGLESCNRLISQDGCCESSSHLRYHVANVESCQ